MALNCEKEKIVISGMSINTPLGDSLGQHADAMYAGESALKNWASIDASNIYSKVGADLGAYDLEEKLNSLEGKVPTEVFKKIRKMHVSLPWSTKISTTMAVDAFIDGNMFSGGYSADKIGVIVSGHNINVNYDFENRTEFDKNADYIDPLYGLQILDTDHAASVSEVLQLNGPVYTIGAACASGNLALRNAVDELRYHDMEAILVVGPVLNWSPLFLHSMALMGAISFQNFIDTPKLASRPYDVRREGFVPAHGGGALLIEKASSAKARGVDYYAEIMGVEASSSGSHLPTPSAKYQAQAMNKALHACGIDPKEINYLNAHATSTPQGDLSELKAIKQVFGDHAYDLKINAPKSMLGHTCWSAPIVELVTALSQLNRGKIHKTINIDELDPQVDLDVCAYSNEALSIRYLMKNSFGFGGINCVSVLKAPDNCISRI